MKYSKEFIQVVEQELEEINAVEYDSSETEEVNGKYYFKPHLEELKIEFEHGP